MAINYTLKLKQKNGQIESSSAQFEGIVTIGRSETAQIRLEGALVALNHAKIEEKDGRLQIEDLGSFSGTKVDQKLVTRKALSCGEVIQIGESSFTIGKEDNCWLITEERSPKQEVAEDSFIEDLTARLDHKRRLPSITLISSFFAVLVLAFFFIFPLQSEKLDSWSSGPISNKHHNLGNDCRACHTDNFKSVSDNSCLSCHNMSDHSEQIGKLHEKHQELNLSCGSCHLEHNGDSGLVLEDPKLCTTCHASLSKLLPESKLLEVASLANHPQFNLTQKDQDDKETRVSLDKKELLKDPNTLKLNHKVHLEPGLAGAEGPTTLTCNACHKLSADKKNFQPITFEGECQSCHPLTFDATTETVSAPHGEPKELYHFLKKYYAALFLDSKGDVYSWEAAREMPGGIIERSQAIEFSKPLIESQSRIIEDQLVNSMACTLCHKITEKEMLTTDNESKFDVEKSAVPSVWFTKAIFDHKAHDNVSCESCHKGVSNSELTSDVLLPDQQNCLTCHHDTGKDSKVASTCITCHSFHEQKPLADDKKIKLK